MRPGSHRFAILPTVEPSATYQRIWDTVHRVPSGYVSTYGQIASIAGLPGRARQVGYALHSLPEDSEVPWHRVINAKGEVSPRANPGWERLQVLMLIEEGVVFDSNGRVDLNRFGWQPASSPSSKKR